MFKRPLLFFSMNTQINTDLSISFLCVLVSVESTGALPAHVLVREAIKLLKTKCTHFLNEVDSMDH